jgi:tRNA(Arg) A34 adenosine deaminase TadA
MAGTTEMFFAKKDEHTPKNCTVSQQYFLDRANKMAQKSTMTHRHGCVLVKNGTIIAEGFNHHFTHMFHKFSIHAEIDTLNKAKKKYKHILHDCEMYVVRIASEKFDCCFKYSRPCHDCSRAIHSYNIRRVYYSTSDEFDERLRSRQL